MFAESALCTLCSRSCLVVLCVDSLGGFSGLRGPSQLCDVCLACGPCILVPCRVLYRPHLCTSMCAAPRQSVTAWEVGVCITCGRCEVGLRANAGVVP